MKQSQIDLVESIFGSEFKKHLGANLRPSLKRQRKICHGILVHARATGEDHAEANRQLALIGELEGQLDAEAALDLELRGVPEPTRETIRAVGREAGGDDVIPDGLRKDVAKLEAAYQKDLATMMSYIPRAAADAYRAHAATIQAGIESGKDVRERDAWTLEDYEQDYRAKCSAAKLALKRHGDACFDLVLPVVEQVCAAIREYAETKEANERSLHEEFKIPYVPSRVLMTIRKAEFCVRFRFETFVRGSGASPASVAEILL